MGRPIMVATRAFDFLLNQADYLHAEQDLRVLLDRFGSTFTALGGVESAVLNEWNRLVTRDDVLRVLPVAALPGCTRNVQNQQHRYPEISYT